MKLRVKIIGQDNVGWSIDKDRSHVESLFQKIEDLEVTSSFFFCDIYFFVWYDYLLLPKSFFIWILKFIFRKKIIASITNDIEKSGHIAKFRRLKKIVDYWISPNSVCSLFLQKENVAFRQIPFYVSPGRFHPLSSPREKLLSELNIDAEKVSGRILIGSFQRDSLGSNLLAPKWQKNPDLLLQICSELPKTSFVLLLAGPRRHYIVSQCREKGIPYIFVGDESYIEKNEDDILQNNLSDQTINLLYNLIDVYVVTSLSEGGPKAILEACLTKTFIISTPVGLAPDFLGVDVLFEPSDIMRAVDILKQVEHNKHFVFSQIEANYVYAKTIFDTLSYCDRYKKIFFPDNKQTLFIAMKLRDGAWGGANQFLKALRNVLQKKQQYSTSIKKTKAILINSYHNLGFAVFLKIFFPNKKYVFRLGPVFFLHRGVSWKKVDQGIIDLVNVFADAVIFQSDWSFHQASLLGFKSDLPHVTFLNAVDREIFYPKDQKNISPKIRLIASSWSSNWKKGFALLQYIDKHLDWSYFEMIFVGNTPTSFQNIQHITSKSSKDLAELLREQDIYIAPMQDDACSNAILEALSCGLPVVALQSGGNAEIIDEAGELFSSHEQCIQKINMVAKHLLDYKNKIHVESIEDIAEKYSLWIQQLPQIRKKRILKIFFLFLKLQIILIFLKIKKS